MIKDREQYFGHVVDNSVEHSPLGLIADAYWKDIPQHHFGTELDEHIVMPNHLHGIVIINEEQETDAGGGGIHGDIEGRNVPGGDVQLNVPTVGAANPLSIPTTGAINPLTSTTGALNSLNLPTKNKELANKRLSPVSGSLSVIIRTFKAAVTTWARRNGYADFAWQGRFYDHIIRNEKELFRIREHIQNNPLNWSLDDKNRRTIH